MKASLVQAVLPMVQVWSWMCKVSLDAFRIYLSQQGASTHTKRIYCHAVRAFLMAHDKKVTTAKGVEDYLADTIERTSIKTARVHLAALRAFFAHQITQGALDTDPTQGHKIKTPPITLPKVLTPADMQQLLDAPKGTGALFLRDKAMFELLYSSGLRIFELAGLDMGDLDINTGSLDVMGKGAYPRRVPVTPIALDAIRAYLPHRKAKDKALFVGRTQRRLTTRAIQKRLVLWCQASNMQVHAHAFRHAFASHLLSSSGDLRAVQSLLGHKRVTTTEIYTHLDYEALHRVYQSAHPRAGQGS